MPLIGEMSTSLQIELGRLIKGARCAKGLSQEAFAFQCGYHRTYVGGIERGERNITLATFHQISKALGTPMSSLLKDAEAML